MEISCAPSVGSQIEHYAIHNDSYQDISYLKKYPEVKD